MKTHFFQSCGHCWVFQISWYIECSTLTASYFRIWNSSAGILSPPLGLFIVMLPKGHLTSHSSQTLSGCRWVITPSWLSQSLRSLLYSTSVYSCHLFLISSASVRSIPFLSFIEPIFAWNIPFSVWKGCSVRGPKSSALGSHLWGRGAHVDRSAWEGEFDFVLHTLSDYLLLNNNQSN